MVLEAGGLWSPLQPKPLYDSDVNLPCTLVSLWADGVPGPPVWGCGRSFLGEMGVPDTRVQMMSTFSPVTLRQKLLDPEGVGCTWCILWTRAISCLLWCVLNSAFGQHWHFLFDSPFPEISVVLTVSLFFPGLDGPNFGQASRETKAAFLAQVPSFVHAAQPQPYICSLFSLPF